MILFPFCFPHPPAFAGQLQVAIHYPHIVMLTSTSCHATDHCTLVPRIARRLSFRAHLSATIALYLLSYCYLLPPLSLKFTTIVVQLYRVVVLCRKRCTVASRASPGLRTLLRCALHPPSALHRERVDAQLLTAAACYSGQSMCGKDWSQFGGKCDLLDVSRARVASRSSEVDFHQVRSIYYVVRFPRYEETRAHV